MRVYKNHYYTHAEGSNGFSWHRRLRDALAAWEERGGDEEWDRGPMGARATPVEIKMTVEGVLAALNRHGNHPANG